MRADRIDILFYTYKKDSLKSTDKELRAVRKGYSQKSGARIQTSPRLNIILENQLERNKSWSVLSKSPIDLASKNTI